MRTIYENYKSKNSSKYLGCLVLDITRIFLVHTWTKATREKKKYYSEFDANMGDVI